MFRIWYHGAYNRPRKLLYSSEAETELSNLDISRLKESLKNDSSITLTLYESHPFFKYFDAGLTFENETRTAMFSHQYSFSKHIIVVEEYHDPDSEGRYIFKGFCTDLEINYSADGSVTKRVTFSEQRSIYSSCCLMPSDYVVQKLGGPETYLYRFGWVGSGLKSLLQYTLNYFNKSILKPFMSNVEEYEGYTPQAESAYWYTYQFNGSDTGLTCYSAAEAQEYLGITVAELFKRMENMADVKITHEYSYRTEVQKSVQFQLLQTKMIVTKRDELGGVNAGIHDVLVLGHDTGDVDIIVNADMTKRASIVMLEGKDKKYYSFYDDQNAARDGVSTVFKKDERMDITDTMNGEVKSILKAGAPERECRIEVVSSQPLEVGRYLYVMKPGFRSNVLKTVAGKWDGFRDWDAVYGGFVEEIEYDLKQNKRTIYLTKTRDNLFK